MNSDNIAINFARGGISGICGVCISHPFDTIKTNFQENKKISYKITNLYRGIIPPIIGVGLEKAVVFGTYETSKYYLRKHNLNSKYDNVICGALSGFNASIIVTPFERMKILLQANINNSINKYNHKFLFQGLSATFTRETPGFAIYFTVYEYLKNKYYHKKKITPTSSFTFGAIAGIVSWIFIYPQDRVKTKMQIELSNQTFMKTIKNIYTQEGLKSFYRGFHLALMRAVPLHAGTFMMMEILKNK